MTRGFSVKAFDVYGPSLEKAKEQGIEACCTPASAAEGAQVLCLMVVNAAQVDEVLFGAEGTAAGEYTVEKPTESSQRFQLGARSSASRQCHPAIR